MLVQAPAEAQQAQDPAHLILTLSRHPLIGPTNRVACRAIHEIVKDVFRGRAASCAGKASGLRRPLRTWHRRRPTRCDTPSVEAAAALLGNTAQNLLDNNLGVTVPYSKAADDFLQTLKIEYTQQNGSMTLPGTQGHQQVFYAPVDQKNQPWVNQGLVDSAVTGLIVKTPLAPAYNNPTNDLSRDRLTALPLDEQGRYTVRVDVGSLKDGYRTEEPVGIGREKSVLWKKIFEELWRDGVTKDSVAKELNLLIDEIRSLFGELVEDGPPSPLAPVEKLTLRAV